MPYRRLPNTDAARIKALQTAIDLGEKFSPRQLAFSATLLYKIKSFLPVFQNNLQSYQHKKDRLSEETKTLHHFFKRAKMYLTHFIQVASFSVQRRELPEDTKDYYNLPTFESLPHIQSYDDLIVWSDKVLNGEMARTQKGLPPVINPTAGVVRVHYDHFLDQYQRWKILQQSRDREQKKVQENRIKANQLVTELWDEVEQSFSDLPGNHKRARAEEYGIRYVYRSNELRHIESIN
ncbi:MAG: hypothetical protein GXO83_10575 [Chlorobi bacterium]|nr:hypothetical protein [Chlorobiota bacterium]